MAAPRKEALIPPRGKASLNPVEYTFWRTAFIKAMTDYQIVYTGSPFKTPSRTLDMTTKIKDINTFRGSTFFEMPGACYRAKIKIRISFTFRSFDLSITGIDIFGDTPGKQPDKSIAILRSSISHAKRSGCSIGLNANPQNGTFIKCCSGWETEISFDDALSLYEKQYVKANWLPAIHSRDRAIAMEQALAEMQKSKNATQDRPQPEIINYQGNEIDRLMKELSAQRKVVKLLQQQVDHLKKDRPVVAGTASGELEALRRKVNVLQGEYDKLKSKATEELMGGSDDSCTVATELFETQKEVASLKGEPARLQETSSRQASLAWTLSMENASLQNKIEKLSKGAGDGRKRHSAAVQEFRNFLQGQHQGPRQASDGNAGAPSAQREEGKPRSQSKEDATDAGPILVYLGEGELPGIQARRPSDDLAQLIEYPSKVSELGAWPTTTDSSDLLDTQKRMTSFGSSCEALLESEACGSMTETNCPSEPLENGETNYLVELSNALGALAM